jgi:hypothetical protein
LQGPSVTLKWADIFSPGSAMMRSPLARLSLIISVVLGGATLALWIESHASDDWCACHYGSKILVVDSAHGSVRVDLELRCPDATTVRADFWGWHHLPYLPDFRPLPWNETWKLGQFAVKNRVRSYPPPTPPDPLLGLALPYWFLCLIFFFFPATWMIVGMKKRSGAADVKCRRCGYDLRASPLRCPECGTARGG